MNFGLDQYAPYVWASYAIFVAILVWDFLMPQLHMRRVRRELAAHARREAARTAREGATP
ncbi:heme exporter protein CcmD [Xanthomonadaceae bacterium JHOS43]|nr:heme exporter protein CcmD [Xanthomonadaceae bacterium JHOS43]MCX7562704.1 heme exporter protein CcmD [Xanthomonadaceae bacterium XH05]